eukprot:TRINITY_DN6730_c0_g2_i1.p1 TRINITY_DN6730_c0_g2~~TRINITY_DN6730_c0_g2_i1.p1  ORF type:complete len:140 (-),score=34.13 TRINITY_DN6730_c0_g2_i1:7-375(-)
MDALHIEKQKIECHLLTDAELRATYEYNFAMPYLGLDEGVLEPEQLEEIRTDPEAQEILQEEYKQIVKDRNLLRTEIFPQSHVDKWPLPVNLTRLINNAKTLFKLDPYAPSDLKPHEVVKKV